MTPKLSNAFRIIVLFDVDLNTGLEGERQTHVAKEPGFEVQHTLQDPVPDEDRTATKLLTTAGRSLQSAAVQHCGKAETSASCACHSHGVEDVLEPHIKGLIHVMRGNAVTTAWSRTSCWTRHAKE